VSLKTEYSAKERKKCRSGAGLRYKNKGEKFASSKEGNCFALYQKHNIEHKE